MRRLALISGVAIAILGVAAVPASAKAPSGGSTTPASLTVDNDPPVGGSIALTAAMGSMRSIPEESVTCTSNGVQVYLNVQTGTAGATSWTASWTMESQTWQDAGNNPGTCVASLYYYVWQGHNETGVVNLASASFLVG